MKVLHPSVSSGIDIRIYQVKPIPLDVLLKCEAGEVLALVGPSGSGKTTILRCIAGLYRPDQGRILCSGKVWLDTDSGIDLAPQKRRAGLVFQHFALFPHLSALENVRLALNGLPKVKQVQRALELLHRVHLQGLESRLPAALSGGQQQRVALARALAREPEVLLLDEPFSAVDQVTRRKLRFEMAQLTKELSIPIILVTHDLDEANMLADQLCVLHDGKTLQAGIPDAIMRRPKDATVARLIDIRNLFDAIVVEQNPKEGRTLLQWQGIRLEANYHPDFSMATKVNWCIPPTDVLLHRRIQPSRGTRENPVHGTVIEMISTSAITNVIIEISHDRELRLYMDLPPHVVKRNIIKVGDKIGVSLLANAIHIMPLQATDPAIVGN